MGNVIVVAIGSEMMKMMRRGSDGRTVYDMQEENVHR